MELVIGGTDSTVPGCVLLRELVVAAGGLSYGSVSDELEEELELGLGLAF